MNMSSDAKTIDTYGGYTLINNPIHDDEGFDKNNFEIWLERKHITTLQNFTYDTDYDDVIQSFRSCVDFYKRNRHGVEYSFVKVSDNKYRFEMAKDDMEYMRVGGREGQEKIDMNDLGMFDPPGGPYVGIGTIVEGKKVIRIASTDDGIFVEVE